MSVPQEPEGAILRHARSVPVATIETLAPGAGLLIICPHPDDETLGCGQALAAAAMAGRAIGIVLLTDGEGSHPGSRDFRPTRLRDVRLAELERALAILAPQKAIRVQRLSLPDGRSSFDELTEKQRNDAYHLARKLHAGAVWSTWSGDPHCDHQCAADLAKDTAKRLKVPHWGFAVWGRFGERPVPRAMLKFHDGPAAIRKRGAMRAYASQLTNLVSDDPEGFVMPRALTSHFADHAEVFIDER